MEIETKEKPHILHFQVKNTGFCQQSEMLLKTTFLKDYNRSFDSIIKNLPLCTLITALSCKISLETIKISEGVTSLCSNGYATPCSLMQLSVNAKKDKY